MTRSSALIEPLYGIPLGSDPALPRLIVFGNGLKLSSRLNPTLAYRSESDGV